MHQLRVSTAIRKAPISAQAYRRPGRLCKVQLVQQVERSEYLEWIGDNTQPAWVPAKWCLHPRADPSAMQLAVLFVDRFAGDMAFDRAESSPTSTARTCIPETTCTMAMACSRLGQDPPMAPSGHRPIWPTHATAQVPRVNCDLCQSTLARRTSFTRWCLAGTLRRYRGNATPPSPSSVEQERKLREQHNSELQAPRTIHHDTTGCTSPDTCG